MKENKNIERLFQEKFKDFEVSPPDFVWDNIKEKLHPEEKKRRVIPFWFKASGIAASFVALLSIVYFNTNSNSSQFDVKGFQNNSESVSRSGENKSSNNLDSENNFENSTTNKNNSGSNFESSNATASSEVASDDGTSKNGTVVNGSGIKEASTKGISSGTRKNSNSKWSNQITSATSKSEITSNGNAIASKRNTVSNRKNSNSKWSNEITSATSKSEITSNGNVIASKRNTVGKRKNKISNSDNQLVTTNTTYDKKLKGKVKNAKSTVSDELVFDNSNNAITQNNKNVTNSQKLNKEFNITQNTGSSNTDVNSSNTSKLTDNNVIKNNNTLAVVEEPKIDSIALATVATEENPLEKLLREKEKKVVTEKENLSKWAVNGFVSPIYFNSFSEGSPLSQEFASNDKTYKNSASYGVGLSYQLSKKIAIKTGVNNLNLDYSTHNINFYSSYEDQTGKSDANIARNRVGKYLVLQNQIAKTTNVGEIEILNSGVNEGSLTQQIQYVEVPMELSYAFLNKKFGIALKGGMSTLFLTKNNISIATENGLMEIGKASNLSSVHFSSNVGLGFSYGFMKNFQAMVEPTLKYQINTFNENAGNFKPYIIGVNTGISYKF